MDPEKKFELEGEEPPPAELAPPTPPPRATTPRAAPVPSGAGGARNSQDPFEVEADTVRRVPLQTTLRPPPKSMSTRARETEAIASGFLAHFKPRFRKRVVRTVPILAIAFLVVGRFCVGAGLWGFALAGAAVGVFAAYRRSDEVVLASVAGAAGLGATALAMHELPFSILPFVIVALCGGLGALAAIDDRLGADSSKLLAAGREKDPKKPDPR